MAEKERRDPNPDDRATVVDLLLSGRRPRLAVNRPAVIYRRVGWRRMVIASVGAGVVALGLGVLWSPLARDEPGPRLPAAEVFDLKLQGRIPTTPDELREECLRFLHDDLPATRIAALLGMTKRKMVVPTEDIVHIYNDGMRQDMAARKRRDADPEVGYTSHHICLARYAVAAAWKQSSRGQPTPSREWLEARAGDTDEVVRRHALWALESDLDYVPGKAMTASLGNADLYPEGTMLGSAASTLLSRYGATPDERLLDRVRTMALGKGGMPNAERVQGMVDALGSKSVPVVAMALFGLSTQTEAVNVQLLLSATWSMSERLADPKVGAHALSGLMNALRAVRVQIQGGRGDSVGGAQFEEFLYSDDAELRKRTVKLLSDIAGYTPSRKALSAIRGDERLAKMTEAAAWLGR